MPLHDACGKDAKLNQRALLSEGTKTMEWTAPKFEEIALQL
jgi:hypothetical protein